MRRSSSKLEYGKGKQVDFDMEIIKTETVDILLKNKCMVDLSEANSKIIFQCINMGNLYSQIQVIAAQIPQQFYLHSQAIVPKNISKREVYEVYLQFLTALSFLYQSPEEPEYSLIKYFQQYKLLKFEAFLNNEFYAKQMTLAHIVDVFS